MIACKALMLTNIELDRGNGCLLSDLLPCQVEPLGASLVASGGLTELGGKGAEATLGFFNKSVLSKVTARRNYTKRNLGRLYFNHTGANHYSLGAIYPMIEPYFFLPKKSSHPALLN